jgi:hypothetical protein
MKAGFCSLCNEILAAMTIPLPTTTCERTFSKMKLIKITTRNSMSDIRLNDFICMPHLIIFDLIVFSTSCPDKKIKGLVDRIDQFNSSFWFERKWVFEYYINNNEYLQYLTQVETNG